MLLTVTTTHRPATDLGFLLHKHPDRVQACDVPFGTAHVLYPEATEERCTAALLLEIDPVGLVRRSRGDGFALAEYVNDRPYVASSFLSVAMVSCSRPRWPAAAASGPSWRRRRSRWRRGCRPSARAAASCSPASCSSRSATPSRSSRCHLALRLSATVRLADLLTHLYVLIPMLDDQKHYWVDEVEIGRGLLQPGVKCRGREYLRIIYGPEYADPTQIDRLRSRSLGRKRSLAVREFGLGVEALERFVRRAPLYRVHECVFAVLALESEPVDPRL
jgi:RNA repair, ligase-Pnkp-associating, region of Hen1/PNKP adenylyltransferase domain, C-terminal region/PNKP adenylyltransferase domain, ligase domain